MSVAIITDSNSGIFEKEANENGIFVVPMPIIIDGKTYFEGIDIELHKFLELQEEGREIYTSQPSPATVMGIWDKALETYDEVVYLPMTSGLSGSCATAMAFAQDYDGKVQVIDNHRISVTLRVSIYQALKLSKEGYSAAKIKEILEKDAYNATIYITVNTLEHLKKSGRVTPAGAAIGDLLHIKPVLTIQGEKLDAFSKVRGMKKAKKVMKDALVHDIETRFGNDIDNLYLGAAYTLDNEEEIKEWVEEVQALYPSAEIVYDPLPLSIAAHTGGGAIGIGALLKNPKI